MLQLHINLCQLKQKKQYILHNVPKVGELQIFVVDMKFFTWKGKYRHGLEKERVTKYI
jgi:hypothetical protein